MTPIIRRIVPWAAFLFAGSGCFVDPVAEPCFDQELEAAITARAGADTVIVYSNVSQEADLFVTMGSTVELNAEATPAACGCCDREDTEVVAYGWDLDDDGVIDTSDAVYNLDTTLAEQRIRLIVIDSAGSQVSAALNIIAELPEDA